MKVIHLISGGDSGGAKTHVFALLDKLKHQADVRVVCLMQGVFYKEIKEKKDIDTVLLEQKSRFDVSVAGKLADMINNEGFDILHVHGARANFVAMLMKNKIKVPVVTTMHSDYLLDFDTFIKKLVFLNMNKIALRTIDYFIAVSDTFKDMLIERGFTPNRIHTVYNGMDFSNVPKTPTDKAEFAEAHGFEWEKDCIYVGIAARFDIVKGVDVFIKSAAEVVKKHKNVRFLIAGDGAERDNLEALVKELGVGEYVKFLGFVRDIYGFLNFIDVNTLTSLCESFPYSMLEGAAMKAPMVSSRVGGIPSLVIEGETGFLFESGDYKEMAEKLSRFIENPALITELGEAIYERATTKFESQTFADRHMEIYNDIIADYNNKKRYDVVLSGYYGFKNSGDDALLMAILNDLRAEKRDIRPVVLSATPEDTKRVYRVDAKNRSNLFAVLSAIKNAKMLISGGGSLIQDETSSKSLWYYLCVIRAAKKHGLKVMQMANGIGPLNKEADRKLAADIINENVDYITLRDVRSLEELRKIGVTGVETKVTADPAMTLECAGEKDILRIFAEENIPTDKKLACISVRSWKNNDENFEDEMAKALDYCADKYGVYPLFVPMQYSKDFEISESICSKMQKDGYIIKKPRNVQETIGIIKSMDFVVAMRLHSLIYAAGVGVGVIAIVYDPKVRSFMEYAEQNQMIDVEEFTSDKMIAELDKFFESKTRESAKTVGEAMRALAKENAKIAVKMLDEE